MSFCEHTMTAAEIKNSVNWIKTITFQLHSTKFITTHFQKRICLTHLGKTSTLKK